MEKVPNKHTKGGENQDSDKEAVGKEGQTDGKVGDTADHT